MIRLGTIGTSDICNSFLEGVKTLDDFKIQAVYSRNLKTGQDFAKKHGVSEVFVDLKQMASSSDIDAVYIASPNSCHFEQSKLFLQNGKHVICEKPITTCAAEYKELKALADKRKVIYMEAIISRHNPYHAKIKQALYDLGKIKSADLIFHQRSSRLDAFLKGEHVNIFDMKLNAGTLMDIGVYCVYAAVDFFGMPNNVTATKELLYNGADGSGTATLYYDGFCVNLSYSKVEQYDGPSVIKGENGVLKIDKISQYAGVHVIKDGSDTNITEHLTKPQQMSSEAAHFADYILHFDEKCDEYKNISELTFKVHTVMDQIKLAAQLEYN